METVFSAPDVCDSKTQNECPNHAKNKLQVPIDDVCDIGRDKGMCYESRSSS